MKNVEASIRARLTQKAKERGITFQYASLLYMQEGLLARIAGSPYSRKLILKGGFLLFANQQAAGRTTKDIDFQGDGIPNDPQGLAEKLESTISLGNVNSRMKDLYDLWFILEHVPLSDQEILAALRATFSRRRTAMPESPAVFSREFVDSERTRLLWEGFTRRSKLGNVVLSSILEIIKIRLEPLYAKMRLMQD